MKVILRESIDSLGNAGEIVKVARGYARNYLLPRGLAAIATENNVRHLEHERHQIFLRQEKAKRQALKLAEELKEVSVTIPRQVGEDDRIFGSVTTRDIAEELRQEGYKINRKNIRLDVSVRKIDVYEAFVKLHPEVEATIKVWVVAQ
jgi:large subunit ribosomal protein L9